MSRLPCSVIPSWLAAHHDGELALEEQVAVEAHLSHCPSCAAARDELETIRTTLRHGAAAHRPADEEGVFTLQAANALTQLRAERDLGAMGRLRLTLEEAPRVWIAGSAAAVTGACAVLLATVLSLATPLHPQSLSAVLVALGSPGSNTNPIRITPGVTVPYVPADSHVAAIFHREPPAPPSSNIAMAGIVTREGRITGLRVLHASGSEEEQQWELSHLASSVRFVPASFAGAPVAVSLVWVVERMTVRADGRS